MSQNLFYPIILCAFPLKTKIWAIRFFDHDKTFFSDTQIKTIKMTNQSWFNSEGLDKFCGSTFWVKQQPFLLKWSPNFDGISEHHTDMGDGRSPIYAMFRENCFSLDTVRVFMVFRPRRSLLSTIQPQQIHSVELEELLQTADQHVNLCCLSERFYS